MNTLKTLLFFLFGLTMFSSVSQETDKKHGIHHLYLEIWGIGGKGRNINYEYLFLKKDKLKLLGRIGIGSTKTRDFTDTYNPDISIPFGINAIYGTKHHIEFGIGQTLTSKVEANTESWEPQRSSNLHANFTIGYRYQTEQGLLLRASYTPLIEFYNRFTHWGGISIGYTF